MATNDHDLEADAARLAAEVQEATQNNKRRSNPDKSRVLVAGGLFGVSAIAILAYFFSGAQAPAPTPQTTATPSDFQTVEGSPFGALPGPMRETVVEVDTSAQDALRAELAALQAEMAALKTPTPAPVGDPAMEARLEAMQAEMLLLTQTMAEADAARQRELELKERELQRLRADLEAASLGGGVAVDPSLDSAEARRRAAEEVYNRRAGSGMIAFGGGGGAVDSAAGMVGDAVTGGSVESRRISANEAFAREGAAAAAVEQARIIVNPANTVMQGTMIQATLETFINSDLPGQIRAVIADDVHSYDGTRVLIPRGSKVIGQYSDQVEMGQSRAMVVWTRIILPNNQSVSISAIGGDRVGQAGISGRVNTHFGSRFGTATLISLLSIAPALALSDDEEDDDANEVANAVAQTMTAATSNSLSSALNRKPTITVAQGSQVTIMVDRDLEIF